MAGPTESAKGNWKVEFARRIRRRRGLLLFAIFVAHTMNPISYRIVEDNPQLRAIYGRYQELYSLDGLALTLAASFVVCAMACCAVRGIAWAIAESKAGFDQQAMGHLAWVSGKRNSWQTAQAHLLRKQMKSITWLGAVLALFGILGLAIPVSTTSQTKDVASLGDLKIQSTDQSTHTVPMALSASGLVLGLLLIGAGAYSRRAA